MKKFVNSFKKFILSQINDLSSDAIILIYGSAAYGKISSDLDVVFILEKCDCILYEKIENAVVEFQKINNMQIDVEVPYYNKLVYTYSEVQNSLNYSLFKTKEKKYEIRPVIVDEKYFSSQEMKKRLLLNILTTYTVIVNGSEKKVKEYQLLAWKNVIKIVSSYNELKRININKFINLLYYDKKTNVTGEDYLGYKLSNPKLRKHMVLSLRKALNELVEEKKLMKKNLNNYVILGGNSDV